MKKNTKATCVEWWACSIVNLGMLRTAGWLIAVGRWRVNRRILKVDVWCVGLHHRITCWPRPAGQGVNWKSSTFAAVRLLQTLLRSHSSLVHYMLWYNRYMTGLIIGYICSQKILQKVTYHLLAVSWVVTTKVYCHGN